MQGRSCARSPGEKGTAGRSYHSAGGNRAEHLISQIRRSGRILGPALIVIILGGMGCGVLPAPEGGPLPPNFHVLEAGRAYRSAQPAPAALETLVRGWGLRTVINLRGPNPGKLWYDFEKATCEELGVTMLDFPLSSDRLPPPDLLEEIITALHTAEYPILIHCHSGANRTGMISALYRMLIMGHSREDALAELSPFKGHFRFAAPCMDAFIEHFEPTEAWLAEYRESWTQIPCEP